MLRVTKPCIPFVAALAVLGAGISPARAALGAYSLTAVQEFSALTDEAQSLARMQQVLHMLDEEVAHASVWISSANVGVGVANLLGGAFVTHRGAHGASVGAYAGGTAALLTGIVGLSLGHRPFHSVYTGFGARQHILPANQTIAATERDWQARAATLRQLRLLTGAVLTGAGTVLVGLTTANLIIGGPFPSARTETHDRAAFGGTLLGLSGLVLVNGITLLAVPGPVETSWRVYAGLKPLPTASNVTLSL